MATSVVDEDETSDNEETFQDAVESVQVTTDDDLNTCIQDCHVALKLFLNNHFTESKARMEPCIGWSMYHALGYGTILYIQAVMTFDMNDIEAAIQAIKKSIIVCNKRRRKISMLGSFSREASKNNYNELTEEEIHAELCYAELLLIRALLTFIQDENLISFVKGGLKIRECYKVYKECAKLLAKRKWESDSQKMHFDSGVRMGVGAFNLMISLLPGKVLKLLEFVGFSGNKKLGLSELEKGAEAFSSLRGPLCSIILIAYHTVVSYVLGLADGDIDVAERLLVPCIQHYPKGALFLFFAGRVEEIKGNIDKAIEKFEESIESQQEWRQFHHLCYWELMWCHCFKGDWLMGMKYAERLCKESRWSKATYTYQKATFLMMCDDQTEDTSKCFPKSVFERLCKESRWSKATYTYQKATFLMMCDDQTEDTSSHLNYLMSEVPKLKQRIAGKSLPIEKFAVYKAKRYFDQKNYLTLPAYELIYTWNGFSIIGKRQDLLEPVLVVVEATINNILKNKDNYTSYIDDYCLALLLKGVCQKHRGQFLQAEQCFLEVLENEKKIKLDTYLPPYAVLEMALLCLEQKRYEEVSTFLDRAKKQYKGYLLESRLHFRVHATRLTLSQYTEGEKTDTDSTPIATPLATPSKEVDPFSNPDSEASSMMSLFKVSSIDSDNGRPDEMQANGAMGNS